jgi:hypothetical protein
LGRKWSAEVLVGLQAMGSVHLALAIIDFYGKKEISKWINSEALKV